MNYYLKIIKGISFKRIKSVIDDVHKKCNKTKIGIFFDMIRCGILYGAGFHDYNIFGWYDKNHEERKTMVTRVKNKKIILYCNDQNYAHIFNNKNEFNERFRKYLNRDFLDVSKMTFEDFEKFMSKNNIVFAKPNVGESGKGIERLDKKDFKDLKEMFDYISSKNFGVIEEAIIQHDVMSKMYPCAVNSLRIGTVVGDDGNIYVPYVTVKFGNLGKYVDNMENDGLVCPVDIETGKVTNVAHTSKLVVYDTHPYTNTKLIDYQLPYIKEAVELVKKAALEVSEIRFVGWDVYIGKDGPGIIEGNDWPGYDFSQLPEHTPNKKGLLPYYKKVLPGLKL